MLSHPRWPQRLLVAGLALGLAACASPPPDTPRQVMDLATRHSPALPASATVGDTPLATAQRISELLARPLDAESADHLAVLNNPGLQASWATLHISEAERLQASRLPNPHLSFSRMMEGQSLTLERTLHLDVLGLLTLPWRLQWQDRQQALARLAAAQDVIRLAAETRKAWIEAVAAQQMLEHTRRARSATDAASQLARRMTQAGHWSTLQQLREQLSHAEAEAQVVRAELAVQAARERLARLLGIDSPALRLPPQLPALPDPLPDPGDAPAIALRERLDVQAALEASRYTAESLGLQQASATLGGLDLTLRHESHFAPGERSNARGWEVELPLPLFDTGELRRSRAQALYQQSVAQAQVVAQQARSEARLAAESRRAAHRLAHQYLHEIVPLRQRLGDETLLRYNGMLLSVWDVLTEARNQAQAVRSAIEAQRDFWIADTDLQTALTGTSPGALATLGAPTAASSNDSAGH